MPDTRTLMQQGISYTQSGQKEQARAYFLRILSTEPKNEDAWLWLARTLDNDPIRQRECYKYVLRINPTNQAAQAGLMALAISQIDSIPSTVNESAPPSLRKRSSQKKPPFWRKVILGLLVVLFLGVVGVLGLVAVFALTSSPTATPITQATVAQATPTTVVQPTQTVIAQATPTVVVQATPTAVVQPTPTATAQAVATVPGLLPKLLLDVDGKLALVPPLFLVEETHYLYGETKLLEWSFHLGNETLKRDLNYFLVMASGGTTNVSIELLLKHGEQETLLGQDAFVVRSTLYESYEGTISNLVADSSIIAEAGDEIVLRVTASGDDFGILYGSALSSISILSEMNLAAAIANERTKALVWISTNGVEGLNSDLFTIFRDVLDEAIVTGMDAEWQIGWGLTTSGKPYLLEWTNGVFNVKEISLKEALALGFEEQTLEWSLWSAPGSQIPLQNAHLSNPLQKT